MAFVRKKKVKGHDYFYLVRSIREGGSVRQKVIKYLGKNGYGGCAPSGFTASPSKDPVKKYTKAFKRLGVEVEMSLPTDGEQDGSYGNDGIEGGRLVARFTRNPSGDTMAHELGHAIEHYLFDADASDNPSLSEDPEFLDLAEEIDAINEYAFTKTEKGLTHLTDRFARYKKAQPDLDLIDDQAEHEAEFDREYSRTPKEGFANLFATCVTNPKRAKRLAPRASQWLIDKLYEETKVRDLMTKNDWWELERLPEDEEQPSDESADGRYADQAAQPE